MSDVTDRSSAARLIAFFKNVKSKNNCPFCNNSNWALLDTEAFPSVLMKMRPPLASWEAIAGDRVYTLVCDNCGFIRQHFGGIVDGEIFSLLRAPDEDNKG